MKRRNPALRRILKASLLMLTVVLVLCIGPRLRTASCPTPPETLVVVREHAQPEIGYCLYRVTERAGLQPFPGNGQPPSCAATSAALQERADAIFIASKTAHERCMPPPTFAAVWDFWSGLFGASS